MLQLLKNPIEPIFMNLLNETNDKVILCSPFIKKDIIKKILHNKKDNTNITVITSSIIASFVRRASDVEAIELLLANNIKVYNHQHLHAKIYSFDSTKAVITSANLTFNGLVKNYEYGVLVDDMDTMFYIEDDLQCLIDDELSGEMDKDSIDFIKNQIEFYKDKEYKILVDEDGDDRIESQVKNTSISLQSWQKDIYEIIDNKLQEKFNIQDIYKYEEKLQQLHPQNNNIKAKIRQILQQLRDKGLIKFEEPGCYKKIFK